ncbi:hypothetical protein Tco_0332336 [Tanacetum coccineum]
MKEVRKKSLRDFHKTYYSGSGTVTEKPPSVDKITPTITSEGTDDSNNDQDSSNEDSEQENESEEKVSDSEQEEEYEDDDQEEEEFVYTPSPTDDKDDDNLESESDDVNKSDKESDVIKGDKEIVQGKGVDAEMIDAQQGNKNLETTQEQVVEDAHVTISTITKKTEVPVTSSSCSSDLASKFLNFLDIPHTDAEIVSPLDVHVHHEVPRTLAPTLLTIPVFVITESSLVYTNILQSLQTFTPLPILTTPNPSPTIETTNPLSILPDFASVFRFNDRITTLEKEVAKLKKDPLHTQVTKLVDEHLDTWLGETIEEFMNFFLESLTARIKEQVKDQLLQILSKEVSNFAPPMIEALIKESRDEVTLVKVSSQPHSTYEAASTLTEFELKKFFIDKMEKSESYMAAPEHRDCYNSLKRSYDLDKDFFFSYDVYSLKRSHKDKDKDEDPFAGSDRGLKKRKLSKDAEPTIDSDMPQDQEGNIGDNEDEPRNETASRRDWFKKPTPLQEPIDPDCTPIDFSGYILNGLKIKILTREILLGPAFKLLKGTRSNFAELEFDFKECYKALSKKLDWENPEGGDYPFDLSKPLPLITHGKRQRVPFEYFINNDLKYLPRQSPLSMIYQALKTRQSRGDVYSTKRILEVTHVKVMRKDGYRYMEEIVNRLTNLSGDDVADFAIALRMFTRSLVIQKRVEDLQLGVKSYQKHINVTKPDTTRLDLRKRHPYTPCKDP